MELVENYDFIPELVLIAFVCTLSLFAMIGINGDW